MVVHIFTQNRYKTEPQLMLNVFLSLMDIQTYTALPFVSVSQMGILWHLYHIFLLLTVWLHSFTITRKAQNSSTHQTISLCFSYNYIEMPNIAINMMLCIIPLLFFNLLTTSYRKLQIYSWWAIDTAYCQLLFIKEMMR